MPPSYIGVHPPADGPLCDFCSRPNPRWRHPCKDFIWRPTPADVHESVGAWTACEDCHGLILTGRRIRLAARALGAFVLGRPGGVAVDVDETARLITELHDRFFEHRSGPPEPIGEAGDA